MTSFKFKLTKIIMEDGGKCSLEASSSQMFSGFYFSELIVRFLIACTISSEMRGEDSLF